MRGFTDTITSIDGLRPLYRDPAGAAAEKDTGVLDDGCRQFIARSTFVLVGTSSLDGQLDVSPRGGPPGFVKVLDERRLVIPDLNGNNRLDSLRNIVEQGRIGLLFIVPGLGETLRINGTACVTTAPAILETFTDELRRPKTAIGVEIEQGFLHCAKAFLRGSMWTPQEWPDPAHRPSPGEILVAHAGLEGETTGAAIDRNLEAAYAEDLANDLP